MTGISGYDPVIKPFAWAGIYFWHVGASVLSTMAQESWKQRGTYHDHCPKTARFNKYCISKLMGCLYELKKEGGGRVRGGGGGEFKQFIRYFNYCSKLNAIIFHYGSRRFTLVIL